MIFGCVCDYIWRNVQVWCVEGKDILDVGKYQVVELNRFVFFRFLDVIFGVDWLFGGEFDGGFGSDNVIYRVFDKNCVN